MTELNTIPIIGFKTADEFETWLTENHDNSNGIWLKIFKKNSGEKTITYAEALDLALCYGWIDSQKLTFDEKAFLQKFCPRRAKSIWSKINIGHIERLTAEAFFMGLNKTNLFSIGFRLQTAKKQETREKRMKEIIEMLAKGEKFH